MIVLGAVIAALGLVMLAGSLQTRWAYSAVAEGPPPAVTPLPTDAPVAPGRFGEVALQAQLDRPRAYLAAGGAVWLAPLYPPDAERPADPVRAMVFERDGAVPEAAFAHWVLAVGRAGTLVELRGAKVDPHSALRRQAAAALRAEGLNLAEDAVFIDPFLRSRREELAPTRLALPFSLSVMALGAGLALFGYWRRRADRKRAEAPAPADAPEEPRADPPAPAPGARQAGEEPAA